MSPSADDAPNLSVLLISGINALDSSVRVFLGVLCAPQHPSLPYLPWPRQAKLPELQAS